MEDKISLALGLVPFSEKELKIHHAETKELLKESTRKPIKYGKMNPEIKKSISQTLKGHETSEATREKISKTISIRNSEKVCGFSLGHSSKAGSIGGRSKSEKKINALKINQQKSLEIVKGSIWMINAGKRARVPKNLVEQRISEGWKIGFKNV